jgi:hypothetical protein
LQLFRESESNGIAFLLSDALGRRFPVGQRNLNWLVVAAAGEDQIVGLPSNLERFPAKKVLWAGPAHGSYPARNLQARLAELDIQVVPAIKDQILDLGDGANLQVLAVGKHGTVLLLEWENFSAPYCPLGWILIPWRFYRTITY